MKSDFQAKFLQHLLDKQEEQGFTLIELLVVIIIIGILSAIALPSFLNQANKAKQSEARTYVGSLNRAQQAAIMERGNFTSDVSALGLGISTQTENYAYGIRTGVDSTTASSRAGSLQIPLRSYQGMTWLGQVGTAATSEVTSLAILCESKAVGNAAKTGTSADAVQGTTVFPAVAARTNTSDGYVCSDDPAPGPGLTALPKTAGNLEAKGWNAIK
ncbi:type IV pilin-like G/H family protein [Kamptonema cortianum]|uniref:Type IV pilin-like G/H family protein n=1 Tax=Geitlerinema calcuttense NRMC-F 0142 TaxID=2922238 RepID=A0ABT7M051_9CYAN|nr:type IV pilin-like G/H family protein [Geitlerinema calcuttense]MDI9636102.1 type IV pilin-like G/H family protein [Geitlerinema splendidum]MDK3160111.1 type IV pilin-like G/H family protein [Kamptonema cortianum]MDL5047895.1 type IV pilin-like G/H family protein [Oscillatoria amoena NRMC-F 0135]MDL5057640.1 type IV pilin-like G/H family protein [Geitlerinema calcuttense NRMC-F 0142]